MNLLIEITVITVIFGLMGSIFREIAYKAEQFIELCEKIKSTREIVQHSSATRLTANINEDAAKVLAHRNR